MMNSTSFSVESLSETEIKTGILEGLRELILDITGIEKNLVMPESHFIYDLDIDSLSMVEVVVQAEDMFGIRVPDADLAGIGTVEGAVDYVYLAYMRLPSGERKELQKAVERHVQMRQHIQETNDDVLNFSKSSLPALVPTNDQITIVIREAVERYYSITLPLHNAEHMTVLEICDQVQMKVSLGQSVADI